MKTRIIPYNLTMIFLIFLLYGFWQGEENSMNSIRIGDQVWMTDNLNIAVFRNGDLIPEARTIEEWVAAGKEGKPAWSYYENKAENGLKYGKIYNWYAVNDPRGLAPEGWRIPTDRDWIYLTDFLGGDDYCGILLKSASGWEKGGNGNNQSGFNALPAGSRNLYGEFQYIGELGYWWTATPADDELTWYRTIDRSPYYVYRLSYSRMSGFSVRCIKE
jgi:uncharacterized protein (TIGR02145 family)